MYADDEEEEEKYTTRIISSEKATTDETSGGGVSSACNIIGACESSQSCENKRVNLHKISAFLQSTLRFLFPANGNGNARFYNGIPYISTTMIAPRVTYTTEQRRKSDESSTTFAAAAAAASAHSNIGVYVFRIIRETREARFTPAECSLVERVLTHDIGEFLHAYGEDYELERSSREEGCDSSVILDFLVEVCARTKATVRLNEERRGDCECARLIVDIGGARISAARASKRYPLLHGISAEATRAHIERATRVAHTMNSMREITVPEVDDEELARIRRSRTKATEDRATSLTMMMNVANGDNANNDRTIVEKNSGCGMTIDDDARRSGVYIDLLRARVTNAYGRMAVIEPKLFVARWQPAARSSQR